MNARLPPLDAYTEARPLLRHIRVMERVIRYVDSDEQMRRFLPELHCAYMRILQEEFASDAFNLAIALTALEDAFPEIVREVAADR